MSQASKTRARLKTVGKQWTPFVQIEVTERMRVEHAYLLHVHSMFQNSRYAVHCFAVPTVWGAVMQCDVRPHLQEREVSWSDLQRVKDELFSPDAVALEIFPAQAIAWQSKQNIRIIYVLPVDFELPMGLHLPTAFGGIA